VFSFRHLPNLTCLQSCGVHAICIVVLCSAYIDLLRKFTQVMHNVPASFDDKDVT